jgi:hypothetical protein
MRKVQVNVVYRWFERLPDRQGAQLTYSKNRRRRCTGTTVYQVTSDEIVCQAIRRCMAMDACRTVRPAGKAADGTSRIVRSAYAVAVREQCMQSVKTAKDAVHHVQDRAKAHADARRLSAWGRRIYARCKETVGAQFRRCQAVARTSLRAHARFAQGRRTVFAGGDNADRQERCSASEPCYDGFHAV